MLLRRASSAQDTTRIPGYNITPKKSVTNVHDVINLLYIGFEKKWFLSLTVTSPSKITDVKSLIAILRQYLNCQNTELLKTKSDGRKIKFLFCLHLDIFNQVKPLTQIKLLTLRLSAPLPLHQIDLIHPRPPFQTRHQIFSPLLSLSNLPSPT